MLSTDYTCRMLPQSGRQWDLTVCRRRFGTVVWTRAEVIADIGVSEAELRLQLLPLLHADLVKERAEGGELYLVTID